MQEVSEYRRYAEICRRLSRAIGDGTGKRQLMEMATVWTLLADEREETIRRAAVAPAANP
jgi:hypothetical protein